MKANYIPVWFVADRKGVHYRFELLFNSSVSLFYERAFLRRIVAGLSYIGCKDAS